MMKVRGRKPKPPVGMELTLTLSLPDDNEPSEDSNAIRAFADAIDDLAKKTKCAWLHIRISGIPGEFEERIQQAVDECNAAIAAREEAEAPNIRLVVDNK